MSTTVVIDYGMGNLHSIAKALKHVAPEQNIVVSDSARTINAADRVVLPGVGAMGACMTALKQLDLLGVIKHAANDKPFLGICLGMQALLSSSEEAEGVPCLDIIPGQVREFPKTLTDDRGQGLKIPHMGWSRVKQSGHPLWQGIPDDSRFYFVHSFYAQPEQPAWQSGLTDYGLEFASAIARDSVFAVQFHPEKSQAQGLLLLKNFLAWNGQS